MPLRSQEIHLAAISEGALIGPRRSWVHGEGQRVLKIEQHATESTEWRVQLEDLDVPSDDPERTRFVLVSTRITRNNQPTIVCPDLRPNDLDREQFPPSHDDRTGEVRPHSVDWTKSPRKPVADELRKGDLLHDKIEGITLGGCRVKQVAYDLYTDKIRVVLTDLNGTSIHLWYPDEETSLPRPREELNARTMAFGADERRIRLAEALANPVVIGYYRHQETQAVWEFIKHPTGRGMWPPEIPVYDPTRGPNADGSPIRSQPPRQRGLGAATAWSGLVKITKLEAFDPAAAHAAEKSLQAPPPVEPDPPDAAPAAPAEETRGEVKAGHDTFAEQERYDEVTQGRPVQQPDDLDPRAPEYVQPPATDTALTGVVTPPPVPPPLPDPAEQLAEAKPRTEVQADLGITEDELIPPEGKRWTPPPPELGPPPKGPKPPKGPPVSSHRDRMKTAKQLVEERVAALPTEEELLAEAGLTPPPKDGEPST